jgi:arabinofuranan 3-O-arabinosyltransferase
VLRPVVLAVLWAASVALACYRALNARGNFDLSIYWHAARTLAHGHSPYGISAFVYPPAGAVFIEPLGTMSLTTAESMKAVGLTLVAFATVVTAALAAGRKPLGVISAVAFLILVAGQTYRQNLGLGNVSAVVALTLAVFCLLAGRGHWTAAALVLAFSLCLKPLLIPALLAFVVWRKWRDLLVCLAAFAGANLLAALVVPHPDWFVSRALPYLSHAHSPKVDPYISTLVAEGRLLQVNGGLVLALRVLVVLAAAVALLLMMRDHPLPTGVAVTTVASVGLLAQYAAGQGTEFHYALALIPLLMTAGAAGSYLPAAVGVPAALALAWFVHAPRSWYPDLTNRYLAGLAADSSVRLAAMLVLLVTITAYAVARVLGSETARRHA